ncbi:MAG: hypothetical protein KBG84_06060 [Planctomycetes bacterium]|nr:hypothetical protein [Planctomycetota bacterium]
MREIGKAKKGDLNGHFAGEQHDAVAPLVRFLVSARQISEVEEGRALSNDGTAVISARSQDTEAYPAVMQRAQGNGHSGNGHSGNNGHTEISLAPEGMEPQPDTDLFGDPVEQPPQIGSETALDLAPASASDTVHDTVLAPNAEPESQPLSLDATEPGMTLESPAPDTVFDMRLEPEAPEAQSAPEKAPSSAEAKTRIMTPRDVKPRAQELAPEEVKIETGPISRLSPQDDLLSPDGEDETSAEKKGGEPEKITTKVEPKPAPAQPGQVVRDTVNFYNQTMALRDLLESNARPAPNATPIATQKLPGPNDVPGAPLATHKIPPPPELTKAAQTRAKPPSAPTIMPLEAEAAPLAPAEPEPVAQVVNQRGSAIQPTLEVAEAPSLDSLEPASMGDFETEEPDTDSTATREVKALSSEAPALSASDDHDEADRKDTDRFNLADLRPAELAQPEGTDKIDKSEFPQDAEEPVRVADEDTASHRDTQRFFVSDLVGVASFKPAPKPVPLSDESEDRDLTSSGSTTGMEASLDKTSSGTDEVEAAPPLPAPATVKADFSKPPVNAGTRIIPEYGAPAPVSPAPAAPKRAGSGRLRASDSQSAEKITEKVKQQDELAPGHDTDKVQAPSAESDSPVKKITDALTRRLRQERDETRKLIEEAEGVLLRLRQTPVSARQPKVEAPPAPQISAAQAEPLPAHIDDSEPQPSAEPEEAFAGLPPLADIASATIHDLRLAEELLETSKALASRKPESGRRPAIAAAHGDNGNGHDDPLLRIERRLGGAAARVDEILSSTSAALERVTGALTREEFEERKRARDGERKPISLRKALNGAAIAVDEQEPDPYAEMSLDDLVSASSSGRRQEAGVSRKQSARRILDDEPIEARTQSGRRILDDEPGEARTQSGRRILEEEPMSRRTSAHLAASTLSDDLSQLLSQAARSTRIHNAPKADNIPSEDSNLELTEGPLWQSLLGIAGMSAFLVALLVWVWFLIASRGA